MLIHNRKGFTLIEILIVMLITSILVLGINAAFTQAHMLWSRVEEQRPIYQNTRLFYNILTEEMHSLYMPKIEDEQQSETQFILSTSQNGSIFLSFFTMNPFWKNSVLSSLPVKVGYEFTIDSDSGYKTLYRTQQLFSGDKPISTEVKETILNGFSSCTIQAADPNNNSWKTDLHCKQKPPKAVKISLQWPKTEVKFETTIKIFTTSVLAGG